MTDLSLFDVRLRGFPIGDDSGRVLAAAHHPADGAMQLPMLTLDGPGFAANVRLMFDHVAKHGAHLAPHAKTPMSPVLARRLLAAGARATTVADIRQAAVFLAAGLDRLIVANEIGGAAAAHRLARLLKLYPQAEIHLFVDSDAVYEALRDAWAETDGLPRIGLLVEIGTDRAGLRDDAAALALAKRILGEFGRLSLSGLAAYEGASAVADPEDSRRRVDALLERARALFAEIRQAAGPDAPLMLTVGGSAWFDRVLDILDPIGRAPNTELVLRSGAIYFFDHGVYARELAELRRRGGHPDGLFTPTLRVWAEVLSVPEPGLAICGMGLRDVSIDQDLPTPLRLWRDGRPAGTMETATVRKLNDQHLFLAPGDTALRVGDVIEFGLSHPCTCIDRHRVIWELDGNGRVEGAIETTFG